jgi:hypothetical protein
MLYKVSDFRQVGMPVRALVATREDAVAFARSIGCGEDDAYIEMVDANEPGVVDVLHDFLDGRAPTPRRYPLAATTTAPEADEDDDQDDDDQDDEEAAADPNAPAEAA